MSKLQYSSKNKSQKNKKKSIKNLQIEKKCVPLQPQTRNNGSGKQKPSKSFKEAKEGA